MRTFDPGNWPLEDETEEPTVPPELTVEWNEPSITAVLLNTDGEALIEITDRLAAGFALP